MVTTSSLKLTYVGYLLVVCLALAVLLGGSSFDVYTVNRCLVAVLGAIGLNLLMGTAGLVSIGTSGFLAAGAFGTVAAMNLGIPFPLDMLVAALGVGLLGAVVGLPGLRIRGLHLALATLAAFFIVIDVVREYQLHSSSGGSGGFIVPQLFRSKGLEGAQQYWLGLLLLLLLPVLIVASRLAHEKAGRAWRMIRDHELAAHCLGIPVVRYKLTAFVLSSMVIGFSGGLLAYLTGIVSYDSFTFQLGIAYVAMVFIGGIDSVAGAVIGATVITSLPILAPQLVGAFVRADSATTFTSGVALVAYGLLIVLFITSSRDGLAGICRRLAARFSKGRR